MEAFGHLGVNFDGTDGLAHEGFERAARKELRDIDNSKRIPKVGLV